MKKRYIFLFLLIAVVLIFVSCKTTQPAVQTEITEKAEEKLPSAVTEYLTKAQKARQRAIDFESPAYFPSEWEEAEAQYDEVGEMLKTPPVNVQETVAAYEKSVAAYDELFEKTVPLYAQAREDEILSAREAIIQTGFPQQFPAYLKAADDITLTALKEYEENDYYAARETAAKALNEYETLQTGANVYLARREIMDRNFINYDADNFSKAEEVALSAKDEFDTGNREAAITKAEEALLRYNLVLSNGWTSYAGERKSNARKEREQAISERVNIASRDPFRIAEIMYASAEEELASGNFNNAAINYTESEALFAIARQDTADKRLRAQNVIRLAEEKIEASSETAQEADKIIEGGSR
ncbi:MAG: hypothetical protein FWB86_04955 [Treponema sp.]|nr:hypothetical protein [Treponema sp.]MCL2251637.1 hypothetical protein [Treponema sp.]